MSWKWNGKSWARPCPTCEGNGVEILFNDVNRLCCPWGFMDDIEHPENTKKGDLSGIGHKLVRCNKCGQIWRVFYEIGDDSWDVPQPECLGREIPEIKE